MPQFVEGCAGYMLRARQPYSLIHSNFWMSGWAACDPSTRAVPGDDIFTPSYILEDSCQSLNSADFVIADHTAHPERALRTRHPAHAGHPGAPRR